MDSIHEQTVSADGRELTVRVVYDHSPEDPFENWDGQGKIITDPSIGEELINEFARASGRNGVGKLFPEEIEESLRAGEVVRVGRKIMVGLECYEHGGKAYARCGSGNFPDRRWDVSALAGIWQPNLDKGNPIPKLLSALASVEKTERESAKGGLHAVGIEIAALYGNKPQKPAKSSKDIEDELEKTIEEECTSEISLWNRYINGDVYGFVVEDEDGECIESCYGFFEDSEYVLAEGVGSAKAILAHSEKEAA